MRKRAAERTMEMKGTEGTKETKGEHKEERRPEAARYGGKLRVIVISDESTDQVTDYRRAPTRKNRIAPSLPSQKEYISAMDMSAKKDRTSAPEPMRRRVRRVSLEGAAEIRRKSAEEYEFRMAAGARLQAEWRKQREGLREIKPALTLTAPEEHRRGTEVEPGQVLIKPSDVRPIAGTKEKTLRALAIHMVQHQLAGPYAGINPEDVKAVGKPAWET